MTETLEATGRQSPTRATATLWRHSEFLKLWTAQTISVFGDNFTALALPLIAAITLNATPGQMGILTAVERVPFLVIGLLAGVWVDRIRRRPVLITGDLGRGLVLLSIPLAATLGVLGMPQLYVVGLVVGTFTLFFDVAYQAYLPALVDRRQLIEGNSKLEATRSISQLAGPGIAGAVIQLVTAPLAVILDAVSFFLSAGFLGTIRLREDPPARTERKPMLAEVREGLGVVFGSPYLRSIAGCTGTSNLFATAVFTLYILFATRELGLNATAIGVIFSVGNVAALGGALTAGRLGARLGVGRVIIASAIVFGVGAIPIVLAQRATAYPLLILSGLLFSFFNPVYNINQVSLRQAITPQRLQGRMNATMRFLVWGTMPLGGLLGGALGDAFGLRTAIAIGAVGGMTAFLWVLFSPVRGLRAIPEGAGERGPEPLPDTTTGTPQARAPSPP
jgi:MFS family permease